MMRYLAIMCLLLLIAGCSSDQIIQEHQDISEGVEEIISEPVPEEPACVPTLVAAIENFSYPMIDKYEVEEVSYVDHELRYEMVDPFRVLEQKRQTLYVYFDQDRFRDIYENIVITGWDDQDNTALFTAELDGRSLLVDEVEIRNADSRAGNFTIERLFPTESGSDYYIGDGDNVKVVELGPDETGTVSFEKAVACYKYRDLGATFSGNTLPFLIEFENKYGIGNEDAILFPKMSKLWACVSARYRVFPPTVQIPVKTFVEKTGMVETSGSRVVYRITETCE